LKIIALFQILIEGRVGIAYGSEVVRFPAKLLRPQADGMGEER
jgi:hypothetical protein